MNGKRALVLFSGGLDSATALYWAKTKFDSVSLISFNYSGRLVQEKLSFETVSGRAGIKDRITVDLPFMREASEARDIERAGIGADSRSASYVPARNLIFYSIAAHFAEYLGASDIIGGHNLHDAEFFRDSSPGFIEKLNHLLEQSCLTCDGHPYKIILPLATMSRQDVVELAMKLGVPIELTWSCHNDGNFHCGKCYSCVQRLQAFSALGLTDPVFDRVGAPSRDT